MTTAKWETQTAVYARLTADATLAGLVAGVFDEVPESTVMPYVVLGEATEESQDSHDRQGLEVTLTLHIWSRYRGYDEAAGILRELDRLLDRVSLTVDGFTAVSIAQQMNQFMRDPNPEIRHVTVQYRVWLTEEQEP